MSPDRTSVRDSHQARGIVAGLLLVAMAANVCLGQATTLAQNDTDDNDHRLSSPYAEVVRADKPVAWWRFDDGQLPAELNGALWLAAEVAGEVQLDQPGPQ